MTLLDYSLKNYPDVVEKYEKIAANCHKRISDLNVMIQQVRQEKLDILRSPGESDKDNSTMYMNLPSKQDDTKSNTSSEIEQEQLTKQLLHINLALARQLEDKVILYAKTSLL